MRVEWINEEYSSRLVYYKQGWPHQIQVMITPKVLADNQHITVQGAKSHLDSVCSSCSLQSIGQCRPWDGEQQTQLGSPEFLWCHCPESLYTTTKQLRTGTMWLTTMLQDTGPPSMQTPAAVHYLWARQKKTGSGNMNCTDCSFKYSTPGWDIFTVAWRKQFPWFPKTAWNVGWSFHTTVEN